MILTGTRRAAEGVMHRRFPAMFRRRGYARSAQVGGVPPPARRLQRNPLQLRRHSQTRPRRALGRVSGEQLGSTAFSIRMSGTGAPPVDPPVVRAVETRMRYRRLAGELDISSSRVNPSAAAAASHSERIRRPRHVVHRPDWCTSPHARGQLSGRASAVTTGVWFRHKASRDGSSHRTQQCRRRTRRRSTSHHGSAPCRCP